MTQRLRFLLDTNILIPLEDSMLVLRPSLAAFVRLAGIGGHELLYHRASISDIHRDKDIQRRTRTIARLSQYTELKGVPPSPLNTGATSANDACDNDILHALACSAVHALVTEDKEIHSKARHAGLADRVYNIQTAEDWLRRLHEPAEVRLPNIEDVPMYSLTNSLGDRFFDSLRISYDTTERSFNDWFHEKAQTGRRAWIARADDGSVEALCIYAEQMDEVINESGCVLKGRSLKLCTFKVGELIRGRKIGELFLKAAFRFATDRRCENIFVHSSADQFYLLELLCDFGFQRRGMYGQDVMLVKEHPIEAPADAIAPLDYAKRYFPHYRNDIAVAKFIVPIQAQYHEILFPELAQQPQLFHGTSIAGNAIKQAYLCKASTNKVTPGDLVLFYRTGLAKLVTTIGVVERYEIHNDASTIMQIVRRRTVYSQKDIEAMAQSSTKVMLFRIAHHLNDPVTFADLLRLGIVNGSIQSITQISDDSFFKLIRLSGH